jgi:hypothetical protein
VQLKIFSVGGGGCIWPLSIITFMVGMHWNRLDSRAIVPDEAMQSSHDVLLAPLPNYAQSPSAFSMGVYSCGSIKSSKQGTCGDEDDDDDNDDDDDDDQSDDIAESVAKPMPLLYVSPAVAADRADSCSPIKAGWYLTAHPGQSFEVRVSPTAGASSVERTCATADIIIVSVHVDGLDSSPGGFAFQRSALGCEARFPGFVESVSRDTQGGLCVLRRFAFRKAELTEEPSTGTGKAASGADQYSGAIRLVVESAKKAGLRKDPEERHFGARKADPVNERDAVKKGNSLGVDRMGKKMTFSSSSFQYTVLERKVLPECEIVIHIRERFWMESRRLIDAHGSPCTKEMALAMVQSALTPSKRAPIELDGPTLKRNRKDSNVKPEPAEVVDLT